MPKQRYEISDAGWELVADLFNTPRPRPFRWHRKADEILASVGRAAEALGRKI